MASTTDFRSLELRKRRATAASPLVELVLVDSILLGIVVVVAVGSDDVTSEPVAWDFFFRASVVDFVERCSVVELGVIFNGESVVVVVANVVVVGDVVVVVGSVVVVVEVECAVVFGVEVEVEVEVGVGVVVVVVVVEVTLCCESTFISLALDLARFGFLVV